MPIVTRIKVVDGEELWRCCSCNEYKLWDDFTLRNGRPRSRCRACVSEENRRYRVAHGQPPERKNGRRVYMPNGEAWWRCSTCKKYKPLAEYPDAKSRTKCNSPGSYCSECSRSILRKRKKISNRDRNRHKSIGNYVYASLAKARQRARKKGFLCAIDKDFLLDLLEKQHWKCFWTDTDLTFDKKDADSQMSIERLDSNLGYTPENVVWACVRVNRMKGDMTKDQFFYWCKAVLNKSS